MKSEACTLLGTSRSEAPQASCDGPPARDLYFARLSRWIGRALGGRHAHREAYLSASVDTKDYEYRLKLWQEGEDDPNRLGRAQWL